MLKITVEGNIEEIRKVKHRLDTICFISENCPDHDISCEECEKGKVEAKYIVKEG